MPRTIAVACVIVLTLLGGHAGGVTYGGSPGKIAFTSTRGGRSDVFTMTRAGRWVSRLTKDVANDQSPQWSPSGRWIVFRKSVKGNFEIYKIRGDGTGETRLTRNAWHDGGPQFSPDGKSIVFHSDRDGDNEIYVMKSDGSETVQITDNSYIDSAPAWCSSGGIVYTSRGDLHHMQPDGSLQTLIVALPGYDFDADCSPDGTEALFTNGGLKSGSEIYLTSIDGSVTQRITTNNHRDGAAHWHPARRVMLFVSRKDGDLDIYRMGLDGSHRRKLTHNRVKDQAPSWQPNP